MRAASLSLPTTTMHPYMEALLPTACPSHVHDLTTRGDRRWLHSFSHPRNTCPTYSTRTAHNTTFLFDIHQVQNGTGHDGLRETRVKHDQVPNRVWHENQRTANLRSDDAELPIRVRYNGAPKDVRRVHSWPRHSQICKRSAH